ncbi:MAG: hypothetical protein Q9192_006445 [Flavoplaca navasiana]
MVISSNSDRGVPIAYTQQDQPPAMRLRNRNERKAPRRYVEELEIAREEEEEGAQSQKYVIRLPKHGAYRGPVIEFNPDLPPALFPTLDPRVSNIAPESSRAIHTHTTQHNPSDDPSPSPYQPEEQRPSEAKFEPAPDMPNGNRRPPGFDPRLWREFRPCNPGLDMVPFQGPEIYDTSNEPHNPVWMDNMRRMEEMGNMDDYEIEVANMATSDEEEDPKDNEKPPWDEIPLRLRMEMVVAASGDDTSVQSALLRLNLTSAQFFTAADDFQRYAEEDQEEDANIAKHQQLMNEILLNGPRAYNSREGFQALASAHLYKHVGRPEPVISQPDVEKAKAYMRYCRLDASFLDNYLPPPGPSAVSTQPAMCTVDEHDDQSPPAGSASKPISIDDTLDYPILPGPSTPIPPILSNGIPSKISLTPVAQRHQTPSSISPVPLQLGTPVQTHSNTKSTTTNRVSSRQSTGSTIEVQVDRGGPLQGLCTNLHAANRNLANGNWSHPQEPARGSSTNSSHSTTTPSRASNGNTTHTQNPNSGCDSIPPPKRKKPNPPKNPSPAVMSANSVSEDELQTIDGNQPRGLSGAAATRAGPLPYQNPTQQSPSKAPLAIMAEPVHQLRSSTTEERQEWAHKNGYGVDRPNGLAHSMGNADVVENGSLVNGNGIANRMNGNGMNGHGNGIAMNGNGLNGVNGEGAIRIDVNGDTMNENGLHGTTLNGNNNTETPPAKKKPGRPRKQKA